MVGGACDTVHFQSVGFHEVQSVNAGETNDFTRAIVVLDACGHIQRARGHAAAQRFENGVATDDEIVGF